MTARSDGGRGREEETLLVADVGNSRIKLARVRERDAAGRLPRVDSHLAIDAFHVDPAELERWLATVAAGPATLLVASVHDEAAGRLERAVAEGSAAGRAEVRCRRVTHTDLPLAVALEAPARVGIDRLAAAAAAATLRPPRSGAVVVDCGTAVTVDLVDRDGRFLGGAILPGPALQARALERGTSLLPEIESLGEAEPPPMPGRHTREAIAAGIGWGIRGAVRELVTRALDALGGDGPGGPPVIVTGGWGRNVLPVLPGAVEVPDLVLAGIAMAAGR